MKGVLAIFGLGAAAIAGYLAEPSMRYQLTGHSPHAGESKPGTPAPDEEPGPPAAPPPPVEPTAPVAPEPIDLATLTPAQLPAQVTLKVATEVVDASGLKMKIDAGNRLRLVRLEGDVAVVSPGSSPFEGRVPVAGTDLMEQLAADPPPAVPVEPPAVTPVDPSPEPQPTPEPAMVPNDPTPPDDSQEPTDVTPGSEPYVIPEPAPAPIPPAAVDVVAVMKKHISEGNIKEFTFNQVQGWKAEADEVIDGETYQIGLVRYNAETIFGNKVIEAKALIQSGQVVRWIWPKSNMEIK
jgi:hypothetical protein